MKRKLLTVAAALFLSAAVFAEGGLVFNIDYPFSIVKPTFVAQTVTYKYNFGETFALDGGVRIMENVYPKSSEPVLYIAPLIDIYASIWYFGGGCLIPVESSPSVSFYLRSGFNFGNWKWGPGFGSIHVGLELSPTAALEESDDDDAGSALGAAIASVFTTIFNVPKLNVGVTYYLPLPLEKKAKKSKPKEDAKAVPASEIPAEVTSEAPAEVVDSL